MNKSCSNFERLMETNPDPKDSTIFPQFGSIRTQIKKLHQSPAYELFEKLKYHSIDYSEHLAEKISFKAGKPSTSQQASSVTDPSTSALERKNIRIKHGPRGTSYGGESGSSMQQRHFEEAGLHKKKANLYRLAFPCNKLSPAIEEDLAASFKINLKANLKKTMQFTLVDDPTKAKTPSEVYKLMGGQGKFGGSSNTGNKKTKAPSDSTPHEILLRGTGSITSVKDFLRGYDELGTLNNFMGSVKPIPRATRLAEEV